MPDPLDDTESTAAEESVDVSTAENTGRLAGGALASPVTALSLFAQGTAKGFGQTLTAATNFAPRGHTIWQALAITSLKRFQKTSGADAINLVARSNNHITPEAVKWSPSTDDDPEGYWQSKDGEEKWHPGTLGEGVDLFGGKVPVILSHEDNIHSFKPVQATISEVVDMDQVDELVHYDTLRHVTIEQEIDPQAIGGDGAVADGGVQQRTTEEFVIPNDERPRLEDVLIDPFSPDGHEGLRVSWNKTDELLSETTTTEEMQRQEDRGRIAEADKSGKQDFLLKVLLYVTIIVVAATMGPELLDIFFGSGGGGGGGNGGGLIPLSFGGMP